MEVTTSCQPKSIVRGVSGVAEPGQLVALCAPSGLDSYLALVLMQHQQCLAEGGRTIVFSVHQPRPGHVGHVLQAGPPFGRLPHVLRPRHRGFPAEAPNADAAHWAAPAPKSGRHTAAAPGAAHREAADLTRVVNPPLVQPPWTNYWTVERHYVLLGLMPTQDESTDWLPDPTFTNLPLTVPDLWMQQVQDGPCPGATWVGYSKLYAWKNSTGETSLQQRTTFAWGDDPKCCGSGTYIPESCQLANITWYTRPDGKEDLRIYDPNDPVNPLLTVEGLWRPLMPYLAFPFPNSELWGYGILRTFFNDIVPQTDGNLDKDGNPMITSRLWAFWDGEGSVTPIVFDNIGGSRSSDVPGLFPVGFSGLKGGNVRAKFFLT